MRVRNLALISIFVLIGAAICVLMRPAASYSAQDRAALFASSSAEHPAGTDSLGRDRLVRVSAAMLLSLAGATTASALSTAAAACVGMLAALAPEALGWATLLVCDAFLALPWMFLLMMVRSALPLTTSPLSSASVTFLVLASLGWPACARAVYRGARQMQRSDWMLYSTAAGLRDRQLFVVLAPNLVSLLAPQFLVSLPAFVIAEANLGALGLGISEPLPSWGGMLLELSNSATLLETGWVYLPVALLVLVLLSLEAVATGVKI